MGSLWALLPLAIAAFGIFIAFIYLLARAIEWIFGPKNEGTFEEMAADPSLNTNNIDLHFDRAIL